MIEIKRILCPVDFSEFSRRALEYAVVLARWYQSEISVLHVYTIPAAVPMVPYGAHVPVEPVGLSAAHREQLQRDLDTFIEAAAQTGIRLSSHIAEGSAVDQILSLAEKKDADLLVMGTHGRSGFDRLLLGSVAEKVLRKVNCPVLTVPPRTAGAAAPPAFKRLLCAVDFSASSLRALEYALALAQEADATLTVVHVLELPPETEAVELPSFELREYAENMAAAARERLASAIPVGAREYCAIHEVVATGKPYREILRVAGENEVDLVVMGVRGRGAADLVVFGSTTQHVVRQARCPVLTLRTQ